MTLCAVTGDKAAHHVGVCGIAAGSQQNSLLRIDLNIAVIGLEDGPGHTTALFAHELGEQMTVGHLVTYFVYVLFEQDIALFDALAVTVLVGIVMPERRRIERGAAHATRHVAFVGDDHSARCAHNTVDEREHIARLIHPHFDKTLIAVARRIADDFAHQTLAVDGLAIGERRRVERGKPMSRCTHLRAAFANHEIKSLIGRVCRCRHAAVAGADDQQVAFFGFGDIGDFGGFAQPVGDAVGCALAFCIGCLALSRHARCTARKTRGGQGSHACDARQEIATRYFCCHDESLLGILSRNDV